jgi:hypothetical protein
MISIPIRYRRAERGQFIQKLQHAIPSIVVLGDGVKHLSHDPHGVDLVLGAFEIGAALAVIISVLRGFRRIAKRPADTHPDHEHHGIDWIDIFIGLMLAVEAYSVYHATGHRPRPTLLLAATMITIGLFHGKLAAFGDRRRTLRVGPEGISVPGKPLTRMTLKWNEVASIDIGERWAIVTASSGRSKRIDLSDVKQPAAVRDALMQARTFLDESRHAARASIESTTTTA